ncbi:UDP-N-acetylmuramoyl-L-alanine--D-glutamate ligase [Candidatus Saccharibacteria bacterium]|nr:MAG: UDP-N-acetylmuramoyl-L-alanine--D-glutamate ligase [Candidatus Saccharibacteria bacterium]
MKVAIIGYATEGEVSYKYFLKRGHNVTICDVNPSVDTPTGAQTQLGENYLDDLGRFDCIVRSAGIHPSLIFEKNPGVEAKVTTAVDQFLSDCPTKNVIGITGTKGKGTTSTLTAKILEAAGQTVWLGGNIGRSPLEFIDNVQPNDWVVLELSSFQLSDITHSPHIAACLMVVPEHLDWHTDVADYVKAKSRLFAQQDSDDVAIYYAENEASKEIAATGAGQKVSYYAHPGAWVNGNMITIDGQDICTTDKLKLLGEHNWQNVCAATTTVWHALSPELPDEINRVNTAIRGVLTTFSGLEHRLEFVREFAGVRYYDDSFGTTPETAIVAVQAFKQPKIIILGGSDKGAPYDELARAVSVGNVKMALLIGDQATRIQAALEKVGFHAFMPGGSSMTEIITNAKGAAQTGDVVLLSTGCASFGMFQNYKDRGNQFKQAVQSLA